MLKFLLRYYPNTRTNLLISNTKLAGLIMNTSNIQTVYI